MLPNTPFYHHKYSIRVLLGNTNEKRLFFLTHLQTASSVPWIAQAILSKSNASFFGPFPFTVISPCLRSKSPTRGLISSERRIHILFRSTLRDCHAAFSASIKKSFG